MTLNLATWLSEVQTDLLINSITVAVVFYSKQVFVLTHHPTGRPGERRGENKRYRFYLQYFLSHKPCDGMEKQLVFLFDAQLVT